tara:strand:- start:2951 stop:3685 length:735 start_codon:yes stop_codon:yes gene_type:complete
MSLGLGASLGKSGLVAPGIVTDNLVIKHMYPSGAVQLVSDGAAYFDGSDSYISASNLTFGTKMTFMCWAKTPTGEDGVFLAAKDGSGNSITLGTINELVDARFVGTNTIKRKSAASSWVHKQWNHIAAVCDSDTATTGLTIYINGVSSTSSTSNSYGVPGAAGTYMGAIYTGSAYNNDLEGYVCNMGVWNELLTQPEIKSIMWKQYADLTTSETDNLINWWALDEGTGTSVADSKGSLTGALTA